MQTLAVLLIGGALGPPSASPLSPGISPSVPSVPRCFTAGWAARSCSPVRPAATCWVSSRRSFLMGLAARLAGGPAGSRRVALAPRVRPRAPADGSSSLPWGRSWPVLPSTRVGVPWLALFGGLGLERAADCGIGPLPPGGCAQGRGGRGSRLPRRPGAFPVEALSLLRGPHSNRSYAAVGGTGGERSRARA